MLVEYTYGASSRCCRVCCQVSKVVESTSKGRYAVLGIVVDQGDDDGSLLTWKTRCPPRRVKLQDCQDFGGSGQVYSATPASFPYRRKMAWTARTLGHDAGNDWSSALTLAVLIRLSYSLTCSCPARLLTCYLLLPTTSFPGYNY